jgi:hypothetical protein
MNIFHHLCHWFLFFSPAMMNYHHLYDDGYLLRGNDQDKACRQTHKQIEEVDKNGASHVMKIYRIGRKINIKQKKKLP